MEWEPNERDAWVTDAERWICQIQGVLQSKIDLDAEGEVTGVHVVAGTERQPRHIVRDVEGLLKARLGLNVYYKKIGVVQVVDQENEADEALLDLVPDSNGTEAAGLLDEAYTGGDSVPAELLEEVVAPRLQCNGVGVLASETTVRAEVDLQVGLVEARGVEEGPNHVDSDITLIARATISALRKLLEEPVLLNLSAVRWLEMTGQPVVMVAVELVEGRRSERLFGTCPAHHNRQQAVVYAILDAVNRRLALMEFKTGEVGD